MKKDMGLGIAHTMGGQGNLTIVASLLHRPNMVLVLDHESLKQISHKRERRSSCS